MENNRGNYLKEFKRVLKNNNLNTKLYPSDFMDLWQELVDRCSDGYMGTLGEFEHDIEIREDIEHILNANELKQFDDFVFFTNSISENDFRFRTMTKTNAEVKSMSKYWWENVLLKFAGPEYIKDVKTTYDIDIDSIK